MTIYILSFFLWAGVIAKRGLFSSSSPAKYRYQLICLSLMFILIGVTGIKLFWWAVIHPSAFYQRFYVQTGIFPPSLSLIVVAMSSIAAHFELGIGYWLAQQKRKSYVWGTPLAPVLAIVAAVDYTRVSQIHRDNTNKIYFILVLGFALIGFVYYWLFTFCRNPKNRELMESIQSDKQE